MQTENISSDFKTFLSSHFNSIDEIVSDSYFNEHLRNGIYELKKLRYNRPEPKPGFYYKRDWFDRMNDIGGLNKEFFIKHIGDIWSKRSHLSSEMRDVIRITCDKAFRETLLSYSKQYKTENGKEISKLAAG